MNAYKAEAVLNQDGTLTITNLPFAAGTAVEVIVLERSKDSDRADVKASNGNNLYALQRLRPYQYDDPFEPATASTDWEALK
ncbi:MAG: hypothetical protein KME27_30995 [Lyngbya sp. HA4199-MV5]|jgi:hypothetical protein|nr:hypothetical protein [Lyngbya sp. HA4199-MV5]